jgi:hypothetical protein
VSPHLSSRAASTVSCVAFTLAFAALLIRPAKSNSVTVLAVTIGATGLSPRRPGFAPGSIHVGFVVDKVALGQVFLQVLRVYPVNISFHRRSPNSSHLGNAEYASVSRHPRLGTRPTPPSGGKKPAAPNVLRTAGACQKIFLEQLKSFLF